MNFEIWIMYVLWNLPSSLVLSLSKFSSNVKTNSGLGENFNYEHWNPRSCSSAMLLALKSILFFCLDIFEP